MGKFDGYAPEWVGSAMHEAGHAVAFKKAGVRIRKLTLTRSMFGGHQGCCEVDDPTERQLRGYLVAILAGIEAEARYLKTHHGFSLSAGRDTAAYGGRYDLAAFKKYSAGTGLSKSSARSKAASLVSWNYGRIESVAARLANSGRLGSWGV